MHSMLASVLFGAALVPLVTAEDRPPLKFPQEQTVRVRRLVGAVQTEAILLQARLDERQRELAELYTQYELDDQRALKLQDEIVELQRALLANHHRMQVELREIVDQERFTILRQRLRYLVTPTAPAAPKQELSPESKQPVAPERNHE